MTSTAPSTGHDSPTRSGRAVVVGFVGLALALVVVLLVASPRLNADIERRIGGPPPDRAIISGGEIAGQQWVAATEVADGRGCVVVELDGATASEVCAQAQQPLVGDVGLARLDNDPRWFASGVVAADVPLVRLELSDGDERILAPRGARTGFLAGYWVTLLEPEKSVTRVVALDLQEGVLGALDCGTPVVARSEVAATSGCRVQHGNG